MISFRFLLLSGLCAFGIHSYAETRKENTDHYHRYKTRIYKKQPRSINENTNSEIPINKGILSPLTNILCSDPWKDGISISSLFTSVEKATNTQISLDFSILPQWFYPHAAIGGTQSQEIPAWQFYFSPSLTWTLYDSPTAGKGTIDFSYTLIRYWQTNGLDANQAMGLAGGINDYFNRENNLAQLMFSQTFPGEFLTLAIGQYSLYAIDGTLYDNDQYSGFISYALSQNASATYSLGSPGAYLQCNPNPEINIQIGFQDAYNINGTNFSIYNLTKSKYNFYGYASWSPKLSCGSGQYSVLIYNTRKVPEQNSQVTGWSLNAAQHVHEKLYLFGRVNGATGTAFSINRSYVLGLVSENPLHRHSQDLLGVGFAWNKTNVKAISNVNKIRRYESVLEAFASIGFGPYISLTPDFQLYLHPALRPERRTSQVYGLRANLSL
ncbi:Outer membrane protein AaxA,Carbohydrate-selective porin,Carbohydrate-selective porin, OprB family [Chlamydia serpentis]|uniref:Porin n=1 Tax=Chlamydia serpentis TaxID=1967782 RepID=A0A2R8FD02_9CHLA|nr:carbohydrate porin [Chlamydia serpentis]SPN74137.1 Outer membrane protein AaxA,Carbohydrate-selective porin,Carbohydrate-selective porin, OprB family [Chlamydia serpentis]